MILHGAAAEMQQILRKQFPKAPDCPQSFRPQMLPYQMKALYGLATRYNTVGAAILEIGTGQGASAFMLSRAAPWAVITSLTPDHKEAQIARQNLSRAGCANVHVAAIASEIYFPHSADVWDMIYIDGDHNQMRRDLAWWKRLKPGGLLVCHDYSPAGSAHPSPEVYAALNDFQAQLGRPFDVLIVDDTQTGMAGWYR